ncbi:hypothetical protein Dimus_016635 [Dionaea muscipula]
MAATRIVEQTAAAGGARRRRVVVIPYPGRGHLNPMLNFLDLLASRSPDLRITVITTEEWLGLLGADDRPASESICFATIPNVIPSEQGRGSDHAGFMEAVLEKMQEPIERVLDGIVAEEAAAAARVTVVADSFVPWAVDLGRRKGLPVASFWPASVASFTVFSHWDLIANQGHYPVDLTGSGGEVRVGYIPGIASIRATEFPSSFRANKTRFKNTISRVLSEAPKAQCLIFRSPYELESQAIDALRSNLPIPVYPIGPAIPYSKLSTTTTTSPDPEPDYIQWLNSHPRRSVLYVSLGSYLSTSPTQTDELAAGLSDSNVPFLWVARCDPSSFKAEFKRGLIVPWCDQMKVLAHEATGGFLTHCGWNSALETAYNGVPVLTLPVGAEQPVNSKVMVEDWGIGWRMEEAKSSCDVDMIGRKEIAQMIKRFMDLENEERKELDKRAKELERTSKLAVAEGGISEANIIALLNQFSGS